MTEGRRKKDGKNSKPYITLVCYFYFHPVLFPYASLRLLVDLRKWNAPAQRRKRGHWQFPGLKSRQPQFVNFLVICVSFYFRSFCFCFEVGLQMRKIRGDLDQTRTFWLTIESRGQKATAYTNQIQVSVKQPTKMTVLGFRQLKKTFRIRYQTRDVRRAGKDRAAHICLV